MKRSVAILVIAASITVVLFQNCSKSFKVSPVDMVQTSGLVSAKPVAELDPSKLSQPNSSTVSETSLSSASNTNSSLLDTPTFIASSLVLFRDYATGDFGYWNVDQNGIRSQQMLQLGFPLFYTASAASTTQDGKTILFLRDTSNSYPVDQFFWWTLDPTGKYIDHGASINLMGNAAATRAVLIAAFDIDGDGHPDLIFRSQPTGELSYILLDSFHNFRGTGTIVGDASFIPSIDWRMGGTIDLDGNGTQDLIWHNQKTGAVRLSFLLHNRITREHYLTEGGDVDPKRYFMSGGIQSQDGAKMILWRDLENGDVNGWKLDSGLHATGVYFAPGVSLRYKIESSGETHYQYVNPQAFYPSLAQLQPRGMTTYQDFIPDTLDLAERSRYTVINLTATLDEAHNYDLAWIHNLLTSVPNMSEMNFDGKGQSGLQAEYFESIPLMRQMTGFTYNLQVDQALLAEYGKSQSIFGLTYFSLWGKPWWSPVNQGDSYLSHYGDIMTQPRVQSGLLNYYELTGHPQFLEDAKKMTRGMKMFTDDDKGYYSYVHGGFPVRKEEILSAKPIVPARAPKIGTQTGIDPAGHPTYFEGWQNIFGTGMMTHSLGGFGKKTGDKTAIELARGYSYFMRDKSGLFGADGSFLQDSPDQPTINNVVGGPKYADIEAHTAQHTYPLEGMLNYAVAANDQDMLSFVDKSYNWFKDRMRCNPENDPAKIYSCNLMIGFFPEFMAVPYRWSENDELANMINIATKFSSSGNRDYWDDVDHWLRNQFAETQMLSMDWVEPWRSHQASHQGTGGVPMPSSTCPLTNISPIIADVSNLLPPEEARNRSCSYRSPSRLRGAFAASSTPTDWLHDDRPFIWACCQSLGAIALHDAWESMVQTSKNSSGQEVFQVNLLMNRAHAVADVKSWIPFAGITTVTVKAGQASQNLKFRLPEWVKNVGSCRSKPNYGIEVYIGSGGTSNASSLHTVGTTCNPQNFHFAPNVQSAPFSIGGDNGLWLQLTNPVPAGFTVTLVLPIETKSSTLKIQWGGEYSIKTRGSNVVSISPGGKNFPLYNGYIVAPNGLLQKRNPIPFHLNPTPHAYSPNHFPSSFGDTSNGNDYPNGVNPAVPVMRFIKSN